MREGLKGLTKRARGLAAVAVRLPACIGALTLMLHPAMSIAQNTDPPTFSVSVVEKTAEHPFFGQGSSDAYALNDVEGRHLTLRRGVTYVFETDGVSGDHPLYITTSAAGMGAAPFESGVTGNFASQGSPLTFTPGEDAPTILYYQCAAHDYMGGFIHVVGTETYRLEDVADGLVAPVHLTEAPDDSGRLFVVDQAGTIRIVDVFGHLHEEPFLDVRDRMVTLRESFDERGLLGLDFHPDFTSNGRFVVYYSAPLREEADQAWDHTARISEFVVAEPGDNVADPASERIILEVDQPQFNHNGGSVLFGPDGMLYVSLGDGGGGGDIGPGHVEDWYEANEGGNAQAFDQNLLGSILRIDIDGDDPYAIPSDNPFVSGDGLDEIHAFGLRNPYRMTFGPDGELLVADAGQDLWETVYVVEAGDNLGWNVREGSYCFDPANRQTIPSACPHEDPEGRPLVRPVIEYPHFRQPDGLGVVIVGGHVHTGAEIPALNGRYVFGDWSTSFGSPDGRVFVDTGRSTERRWGFNEVLFEDLNEGRLGRYVLGFGHDRSGDVYVLTSMRSSPTGTTGAAFRIAPATDVSLEPSPDVPLAMRLDHNHPNPFSGTTRITYRLDVAAHVMLEVHDVLGRRIAVLREGTVPAGEHRAEWDGTDHTGAPAASGVYVYRLTVDGTAGRSSAARTMVLMR